MKKLLTVGTITFILLLFAGCSKFTDSNSAVQPQDAKAQAELQKQVDDLKKQLDDVKAQQSIDQAAKTEEAKKAADIKKAEDAKIAEEAKKAADAKDSEDAKKAAEKKAEDYVGNSYITVSSPKNEDTFHEEPIIFTGVVSPNTKKITVTASIGSKACGPNDLCLPYQEDVYTLNNFKLGDSKFTYRAAQKWGNLWLGTDTFVFKATFLDATTSTTSVKIYFTSGGAEMGKPVIYLYPQKTTQVSVNVAPTDGISVSVPAIGHGWNVIANTAGQLFNLADNKYYPYLFWEGYAANFRTPSEGFVVAKVDVKKLFEEKLVILGLNSKEVADFEEYWLPKFDQKPYYFITFVAQSDLDKYAPLTVNPRPDSVIRVFFDYKGLDKKTDVVEQKLTKVERKGFTVVEWGGRLYR